MTSKVVWNLSYTLYDYCYCLLILIFNSLNYKFQPTLVARERGKKKKKGDDKWSTIFISPLLQMWEESGRPVMSNSIRVIMLLCSSSFWCWMNLKLNSFHFRDVPKEERRRRSPYTLPLKFCSEKFWFQNQKVIELH